MPITVRPGDVHVLPVPGDNGVTKDRFCIILESYPTPSGAQVVRLVFGCSETKGAARKGEFVRVEREPAARFRGLGLLNATTFHQEDIRHYDAWSSRLQQQRRGFCSSGLMLELRKLADARVRQAVPIPLLPDDKAREAARQSSREWQALQSGDSASIPGGSNEVHSPEEEPKR